MLIYIDWCDTKCKRACACTCTVVFKVQILKDYNVLFFFTKIFCNLCCGCIFLLFTIHYGQNDWPARACYILIGRFHSHHRFLMNDANIVSYIISVCNTNACWITSIHILNYTNVQMYFYACVLLFCHSLVLKWQTFWLKTPIKWFFFFRLTIWMPNK